MTAIFWLLRSPSPEEWLQPAIWNVVYKILGLIIVGVVIFYVPHLWFRFLSKRRRQGMERTAQEMGFSFEADGTSLASEGFLSLPLLERTDDEEAGFEARNPDLSNVMRGTVTSGEVVVLDCQTELGKSEINQTVACLRLAGKQLPGFELRPENIFHKIGSALGYKDIDFQGNEVFSKSYLLRGEDEAAVRMLFHPGILDFFEQHEGKDWHVEGAGEWLLVYKPEKTVSPAEIREFLAEATKLAMAFR